MEVDGFRKVSFYIKLAWKYEKTKKTIVKFVGAGVVCYLTYRAVKYLHVRRTIHNRREAKKQELEEQTAMILKKIDSFGLSREDLRIITELSWDELVLNLQSGKKISIA